MNDLNGVAVAWIAMASSEDGSKGYLDNFWAYEYLSDLCEDDPEKCYLVICKIIEITDDSMVLANLAAGPLEDILVRHGDLFIARVELLAKINERFRRVLGGIWENSIKASVWERVKKVM